MREKGLYKPESQKFHDYASSTYIRIDRGNNRIILTYEIDIDVNQSDDLRRSHLSEFFEVIYGRILKLNQERQYARYYSELLAPFKFTEISFNFHCDGDLLSIDLSPLRLTDIVVPGDQTKKIEEIDSAYSIDALVAELISKCPGG